jgi:glycolate oxidase iron-sulfur subunit
MQTNFTPDQLRDPDLAAANQVLRTCVHCGFCTATCPTFRLLGDELDSPRGRIYLIKDMLEAGRPAGALEAKHIDRCLSCLSCMTTCPSGVHYMHLVDHARTHIERSFRRPWHERALRAVLAAVLPYPARFRAALRLARLGRGLARLLPTTHPLGQRLAAMLALAPARLPTEAPTAPGVYPAQGPRRGRVALLAGCAQQALAPEINAATIRLLTRMGVEVVVPAAAGCCGALTHHMGRHEAALAAAGANIAAWSAEAETGGLDAIVVNASGCGTVVKDYGFMFRTAAEPLRAQAARVAALAVDISEYLVRVGYAPSRPPPGLRVAYHAACSLQHGQQITLEPKELLTRAGFTVVEPAEAFLCCGSAGTYNLMQPEIAGQLRARKLQTLVALRPDVIAAGNIGCITQLAGGEVPVVHTVALLDWMAGGPAPTELGGISGAPVAPIAGVKQETGRV